jgi:hypothetical protein
MEREWTEESSYGSVRFHCYKSRRATPGSKGKLMNGSVDPDNRPAGRAYPFVYLRKPLAAIKGLIFLEPSVPYSRVQLVESSKVCIIGAGEKQFPPRPRDSMHLIDGGLNIREVLDGLTGNHDIECGVRKRESLRIAMNQTGGRFPVRGQLSLCNLKRGKRKIAAGCASAAPRKLPNEAAPAAGYFQNSQSHHVPDLLTD